MTMIIDKDKLERLKKEKEIKILKNTINDLQQENADLLLDSALKDTRIDVISKDLENLKMQIQVLGGTK